MTSKEFARHWAGVKQQRIAELLGISQGHVSKIIGGKPVTAPIARLTDTLENSGAIERERDLAEV